MFNNDICLGLKSDEMLEPILTLSVILKFTESLNLKPWIDIYERAKKAFDDWKIYNYDYFMNIDMNNNNYITLNKILQPFEDEIKSKGLTIDFPTAKLLDCCYFGVSNNANCFRSLLNNPIKGDIIKQNDIHTLFVNDNNNNELYDYVVLESGLLTLTLWPNTKCEINYYIAITNAINKYLMRKTMRIDEYNKQCKLIENNYKTCSCIHIHNHSFNKRICKPFEYVN